MTKIKMPSVEEKFRYIMDDVFLNIRKHCNIGIRMSRLYAIIGKQAYNKKMYNDGVYLMKVFLALRDKSVDAMQLVVEQLNSLEITDEEWQRIEEAYKNSIENDENNEIQCNTSGVMKGAEKKPKKKTTKKTTKKTQNRSKE